MYNRLIRDKIPEAVKKANQIINYAAIANDELYAFALKQKLIEDVNEFLTSPEVVDVNKLVDLQTLINSFIELSVKQTEFKKMYDEKTAVDGAYDKRYVVFLEEPKKQPDSEKECV